ncbi:response regulator transcription factor [Pelagibaculum spongiae]|uniref:DNA-binding response regulator n=1 Tax=Pelagibaculum spongiae TaxID=2080658 RepID=A0A2V1H1D4_9GAMM|nr:response regulator transcription factor [Pelagibaculum spongiae]PVZ68380.1 DNA-binding response regulator [Pelagibaculum spongiae]
MRATVISKCIFLVEDDLKLAELLTSYLQSHGLNIHHFATAQSAVSQIKLTPPELIVLDLMLPDLDGHEVCRQIRSDFNGSIMMFTASEDDTDQLTALDLGVDDFVKKPIQPRVLLARINMLLRRQQQNIRPVKQNQLEFGTLHINQLQQTCFLNKQELLMTPSEFKILWQLASHAEQVQSRDQLLQSLSGLEYDGLNRTIDNKIAQLRKKLSDNPGRAKGIITVRNKGYMFVPEFWATNTEQ